MKIEEEALRDDLRAWLRSAAAAAIVLPEYSADLVVQRRVGRMLASFDATVLPHAQRNSVFSFIQIDLPDKS